MNQEMSAILSEIEKETSDHALAQSIYFGPTALTHIKRLIEMGGSIITDTTLVANDIDESLLGRNGAKVLCFIDDPQVVSLAEQRRVTRAEVAVDYGLAVPGPKLMVVGSAPAAINRMITRRQHEPMSDVCVLAASTGFASVVQLKERLMDSDLTSIVVRGKKGGIPVTVSIMNAILREISKTGQSTVV
ncbi:MAG TPA: precorrin-8X methylmutase [Candidatus Faecivicinus avistercoris]|nr:precorrin-8X methylmutase [Candidatus Faecivicinus avistercoris]